MPHYPVLTPKQIIKALAKKGFVFKRQRGSHAVYSTGQHTVAIPMHRTVDSHTLKGILDRAEIELDDFMKLVNKGKNK
jgi:predicted RNA binding protein YcfA (HicA-like mRNA interferase family)